MNPSSPPLHTSGKLPLLPLLLAFGVLAFSLLDRVWSNESMRYAFLGVGGGLVVWYAVLRLTGRMRGVQVAIPIKQHYIQASVQIVLYLWWGYFWMVGDQRPIFVQAPLIVAQFLFLYSFDALWSWTRGRSWWLSSGPTPIVLSTNLFIWFKDDWFVYQFAMIVAGLLGKEFIRWNKDGRRTHVFNPSGFGLMCAATVLIVTGSTDLTWAKPLATTIEVYQIFLVLFVLGLVVQYFFSVTLMTFAAALTMIVCNLGYTAITDVYLFGSSNLPAAAFLGLMLLMTDPSTSPRTNVGRVIFGAGYGLGYVVFFHLLGTLGAPELYAKLYPVPILNCTVQVLDRFAKSGVVGRWNDRWENGISKRTSNHIHMGLWAVVFVVMISTGYIPGLRSDVHHPGESIAFWKQAVVDGKHEAERKLIYVTGAMALTKRDGEAYNELGILSMTSTLDDSSDDARRNAAADWFSRAAKHKSLNGFVNLYQHFLFNGRHQSDEQLQEAFTVGQRILKKQRLDQLTFLYGFDYEVGRSREQNLDRALAYYNLCTRDYLFAQKGIVRIGLQRKSLDLGKALPVLMAAAAAGDGESCYYLAYMSKLGRGAAQDDGKATELLDRAASLGFEPAIAAKKAGSFPPFETPRFGLIAYPPWMTAFPIEGM